MRASAQGYITDILNARAVESIRRPRQKPFVLYLAHKAVHPNVRQRDDGSLEPIDGELFVPAERHRQLYANVAIPRRPSFGKPPVGKPALLRRIGDLPSLGPATVTDDPTILGRQRALAAVDDGVGSILEALKVTGQIDNTIPRGMEGRSLMPLLRGSPRDWRTSFLVEYLSGRVFPRVLNMGCQAVRTDRWRYIHYTELAGMDELYDLVADPNEMSNVIGDPARETDLRALKQELGRLVRPGERRPHARAPDEPT